MVRFSFRNARAAVVGLCLVFFVSCAEASVEERAQAYFARVFAYLQDVAQKKPDARTFRPLMQPVLSSVKGIYSGALLDADWKVVEVLFPWHHFGKGLDRKQEKGLEHFRWELVQDPGPQVSDPLRRGIIRPGLIELRYPVIEGMRVGGIISLYLRTDEFLKAAGLEKARAFEIVCRDVPAVRRGRLSAEAISETFDLAATEWTVRYDP